jgi:hypothetical protein
MDRWDRGLPPRGNEGWAVLFAWLLAFAAWATMALTTE